MKTDDNSRTKVTILTGTYRIKGFVELIPGARLTDFMIEAKEFIAVIDAEVADLGGRLMLNEPFLNVSRAHVQVVIPRH